MRWAVDHRPAATAQVLFKNESDRSKYRIHRGSVCMTAIFLSYRRSDLDITFHMYSWLIQRGIPKEDIYFDQEPEVNHYGRHFPTSIQAALDEAELILAVIGPTWTTAKRPGLFRKTRIKEEDDWVRKELGRALDKDKDILPVLIEGSSAPKTR